MTAAVQQAPAPVGAPPGGRYFICERLHSTLSTVSCAARWTAAPACSGSTCSGCPVGQQHAREQLGSTPRQAREPQQSCLRCGRSDLRVIQSVGHCASCYNREAEARKGRNAKGKPPVTFEPLRTHSVAIEGRAGVVHHAIEARHSAEAVGVAARMRLRDGEHLSTARHAACFDGERFRLVCPSCGHAGLLERVKGMTLVHHCPACGGAPSGPGWALAEERPPLTMVTTGFAHAWFTAGGDAPLRGVWSHTDLGCAHCQRGVFQVRLQRGGVEVRCANCLFSHKD
ncbi:hypothetical protein ACSFA2_00635 [Variovorax sp. LT2P21]|uniref:hypothetical protein n=1 Tax=Variovorax sp. LT2P21 TaxID=3443731 RepID=UPI003F45A09B